jgi:hypothetical protein
MALENKPENQPEPEPPPPPPEVVEEAIVWVERGGKKADVEKRSRSDHPAR